MQIVKFLLKSVYLREFTAWSSDVLTDKLHPRIDTKILSMCSLYAGVYGNLTGLPW